MFKINNKIFNFSKINLTKANRFINQYKIFINRINNRIINNILNFKITIYNK